MVKTFDGCAVSEAQMFAVKGCKPFGIDGFNDLCTGGLEASLVCFILNYELFVFCELALMIHFIHDAGGWEMSRVLGDNKGVRAG